MPRSLSSWLSYISTQHHEEISLGLARSRSIAARLELLPLAPHCLLVAGTNGKGSTARFAEALLLAQGPRVGTTMSPHLKRFNERVRIDGAEVGDERLCAAFAVVEDARGSIPLTYYEYATLAALWLFKDARVDACVLEIGLGGRLDVINLVDADVAVISSIGVDHQSYLGPGVTEIGAEKAAICRGGKPLLLGQGVMPGSVTALAKARGAQLQTFGCDFWYEMKREAGWEFHDNLGVSIACPLLPQVALCNATLAAAAVSRLTQPVVAAELELAARQCHNPGRFELLSWRGSPLLIDVAHNPAAAAFLAEQLRQRYGARAFIACAGFLADKDVAGICAALAGHVRQWIFLSTTGPRGLTAVAAAARAGVAPVCAADALRAALDCAQAECRGTDMMLALGSFQQIQAVRELVARDAEVNQ